jgi:putative endonuclease
VLAANVWVGGFELDLIARRGRTTVFVEVKSKAGDRHGDPLEMLTPVKVERIRRAAAAWLATHPADRIRFDVLAERGRRIEVLQDAF